MIRIIGVSLSEPHLVRSMAGSAMFVYTYIYVYMCRSTFSRHIFAVCRYNFVCSGQHNYCLTVGKWLALANCSHFPRGGLSFCSCAARHTVSGIHDARVAARQCVWCRSWLQSVAAYWLPFSFSSFCAPKAAFKPMRTLRQCLMRVKTTTPAKTGGKE